MNARDMRRLEAAKLDGTELYVAILMAGDAICEAIDGLRDRIAPPPPPPVGEEDAL